MEIKKSEEFILDKGNIFLMEKFSLFELTIVVNPYKYITFVKNSMNNKMTLLAEDVCYDSDFGRYYKWQYKTNGKNK